MSNIIDKIRVSGTDYTLSATSSGGSPTVELTQAEYDALVSAGTVSADTYYIITDAQAGDLTQYWTSAQTQSAITEATSGKVDSSSVVSSVTSASTDSEIPTAKAVWDAIPTGGGKAIEAGRGISVTTGETADTVSLNLAISAGTGSNSIIEGHTGNTASGQYSHAEGGNTSATTMYAHTEGYGTKASGVYAHAEGGNTSAITAYAHAEGNCTIAANRAEHASGQYNISSTASTTFGDSGNTLFSVGNGTADNARHNAFEIRQNGDIYLTSGGTDIKIQDYLGGGSSYTAGDGIDIINDVISVTGKVDTTTYNTYTAATDAALASKADTATTYTKTEVDTALASKQTTLTAGTGISIVDNVISATGGGGGGTVESAITSGSTNAVESKAIWSAVTYEVSINETLEFDNTYAATNYPSGCNSVTFEKNTSGALPTGDYVFTSGGSEVAKLSCTVISWWPYEVGWTSSDPKLTYVVAEGNSAVTASYSELASDIDGVTVPSAFTSAYTATASGENHLWINENTYRKDEVYNKSEINVLSGIVDTKLDATAYTPTVVDLRLNSGSTNPVQNQVLYDQLEIPVETTETTLTFDSSRISTNYPTGCKRLKIETQNTAWSQIYLTTGYEPQSTYYGIHWTKTDGNSPTASMNSRLTEAGATYTINGNTIELSYPTLSDIVYVYAPYLTTGEVVKAVEVNSTTALKDQVVANTTALGGLKLVKLTQSQYDNLQTKDDNTLYVIVN